MVRLSVESSGCLTARSATAQKNLEHGEHGEHDGRPRECQGSVVQAGSTASPRIIMASKWPLNGYAGLAGVRSIVVLNGSGAFSSRSASGSDLSGIFLVFLREEGQRIRCVMKYSLCNMKCSRTHERLN